MAKKSDKYKEKREERLKMIGRCAKQFRLEVLKLSQKKIAEILGCSEGLISQFELGLLDSAFILSYYLGRGLDLFL